MVRIEITAKGQKLYEESKRMKYMSEAMSQLLATDRKNLTAYLTRLRDMAFKKVGM